MIRTIAATLILSVLPVLAEDDSCTTDDGRWIDQVEKAVDRGNGRVVDEQTWEIDQMRKNRDPDRRPFDAIQEQRDREEIIARQQNQQEKEKSQEALTAKNPPRLTDSPIPSDEYEQSQQNRRTLRAQILQAVRIRDQALQQAPNEDARARISAEFEQRLVEIISGYEVQLMSS